ncbi:thiamine diphosphokinase [Candidatus Gottesmanbacteria bacterium]|nr:thiamine diphosphokinase [Candidatus Gottesmanbacteria bacterium]
MKHSKTVAIVGGGRLSKQFIAEIAKSDYVIGVDRGAYWLIANNIIPDIAIGDFDSVNPRELRVIKQKVKRTEEYPRKKDATDMELAVEHTISLHPTEVAIYGAVGSRLDHTMGNIYLLKKLNKARIAGVIRDLNNEVRVVNDRVAISKDTRYRYVSLLPVTETIEVTLRGFIYDVSCAVLRRGQTLGISNEIRGYDATIEVHDGKALVIRSRD